MRLRDFQVGDTVVLDGALATPVPLYIGGEDGRYRLLWQNKSAALSGKPWDVMASGSHLTREDTWPIRNP